MNQLDVSIEHYAFALFIAGLVCLVAILCKVLFSNVKRQQKMLDEKETKLLQLYQTVESIMDEFNDQAKATTEELKEYERRVAAHAASFILPQPEQPEPPAPEPLEKLPRAERVAPSRIRAANEALVRAERMVRTDAAKPPPAPVKNTSGAVFQRLFDETSADKPTSTAEAMSKPARNEAILALASEGKTEAQIASELGITQNEVSLVIGLTGRT